MKLKTNNDDFIVRINPEDFVKYGIIPPLFEIGAKRAKIFVEDVIKAIKKEYPESNLPHCTVYVLQCKDSESMVLYLCQEDPSEETEDMIKAIMRMGDDEYETDFELTFSSPPYEGDHDTIGLFRANVPELETDTVMGPPDETEANMIEIDGELVDERDIWGTDFEPPSEEEIKRGEDLPDYGDEDTSLYGHCMEVKSISDITRAYQSCDGLDFHISLFRHGKDLYVILGALKLEDLNRAVICFEEFGIKTSSRSLEWINEYCELIEPDYQDVIKKYILGRT